jgi:uncharacterized membrane protein
MATKAQQLLQEQIDALDRLMSRVQDQDLRSRLQDIRHRLTDIMAVLKQGE